MLLDVSPRQLAYIYVLAIFGCWSGGIAPGFQGAPDDLRSNSAPASLDGVARRLLGLSETGTRRQTLQQSQAPRGCCDGFHAGRSGQGLSKAYLKRRPEVPKREPDPGRWSISSLQHRSPSDGSEESGARLTLHLQKHRLSHAAVLTSGPRCWGASLEQTIRPGPGCYADIGCRIRSHHEPDHLRRVVFLRLVNRKTAKLS